MTTTLPPIPTEGPVPTVQPDTIEDIAVLWANLTGLSITTIKYELIITLKSGTDPSVDDSDLGNKALTLTGEDYITWTPTDTSSCFANILQCDNDLGMTLIFRLRIGLYREKMTVLSSGGEDDSSVGFAMFYRYGRLQYTVTTSTKVWYASSARLALNAWHEFAFSWSDTTGLEIYMDGSLVVRSTAFVKRTMVTKSLGIISIGKAASETSVRVRTVCTLEKITFYYARYTVLIVSGKVKDSK